MKNSRLLAFILALVTTNAIAQQDLTSTSTKDCVMNLFANASESMTLAQIRATCTSNESDTHRKQTYIEQTELQARTGGISNRMKAEKVTELKPYVLTPHKMNYLLAAITTNSVNKEAYKIFDGDEDNLEDVESKFQLSLKVPLNYDSMFITGDGLYIGFTLNAWWQVYASNISKPFRETNYQPEIFYIAPLKWHPFGGNTDFAVGLEHQSNGRGQGLSRSWNRVYTQFLFEKDNFALSFKPWLKLSENRKAFPLDPQGDENPDIQDYMGNFELSLVYQYNDLEFSLVGRQNLNTHYGAADFGLTFPLWGKLRGYATAFTGYGESLIDYNHKQTRFGIGISLSDVL